ncbi:Phox homologous domain-containing protein [Sporodiniella umbellata]|nr:Phox homologous domain-containing protein [Sporodiniella umbellata]
MSIQCTAVVNELLELCQNEWVKLDTLSKENGVSSSIRKNTKELREAIKTLVQLQDHWDDQKSPKDPKTRLILEDVKKTLYYSLSGIKPTISQSSPLIRAQQPKKKDSLSVKIIPEEEEPAVVVMEEQELSPKPFGRKSLILETPLMGRPSPDPKNKRLFPLFQNLRPSQSLPVKKEEVANINFYKNDDSFVFATDAVVDHPLRIGVGYGSYICYSCTLFSDKGTPITVRKRYSDFVELREDLITHYAYLKKSIPKLPPKKVVGKFTPTFVEQRRKELEYFFKYVVLHPTLGASPIVKRWIAP